MNKRSSFLYLFLLLVITQSCQKDDAIPQGKGNKNEVSVTAPSITGPTRATASVVVISNDGDPISEKGICWSLSSNPTLESSSSFNNAASGSSNSIAMVDLIPGQRYFYRTYAKTPRSTIYGVENSFVFPADNSTLRNGLVGYYPLNGNGLDYSGNANNLQGSASLVSGRTGLRNSAYLFNGVSDFLSVTNPRNLPSGNSSFTISFWYNAPRWVANSMLVGFGRSGSNSQANYVKLTTTVVNNRTYQSLMHYHWNNDWTLWYYSNDATNVWNKITITFDGTRTRYYSFATEVSSRPTRVDVVPNVFSIGARIETPPSSNVKEFFNGIIDDVRIYNRALTASEVSSLVNY